ncbi:hypothetical protein [Rhodococcus sp. NCIMB 12038]|uniref:hypothetical protein n=1 Tax=Rhodococcus sp. NCIMB 12038 TaxID=933800 RepID=UPI000B3C2F8D|nr:hypothetical protein [Rhodococcus sp. NCIMB 12038]OUS97360.1 hypothetical protein CA951_03170 [Rhodococcus sp. NCIMB 12038]
MTGAPYQLALHPAFERDLQDLAAEAGRNPAGEARRLLMVTLSALEAVRDGTIPVRPLDQMSSYPDLSDCNKVYIQTDPNAKPKYRLVWRERASDTPGEPPVRQVIQLGERELGSVYHLAGQRLGRPAGVSMDELMEPQRTDIAAKLSSLSQPQPQPQPQPQQRTSSLNMDY